MTTTEIATRTATDSATVDWAELVTLDLSDYENPGGKERLAEQLKYAAQHVGFFYVKNFGISQEEVDRQFAWVDLSSLHTNCTR